MTLLRLVGLLALLLALGLTGPARAQSTGEPAPEDLHELIAAVTSTLAEPVYAFDLSMEAHIGVEGEPPLDVQLSGAGALDLLSGSPAFTLDLRGQSTDASGENALNLAARIVNDAIYFAETGDSANPVDWTGARFADFRGLIEGQFASDNVQMGDALTQLQALAGLLPASGVQFSDLLALTREPDELIAGAPIGHLALNIDLARFARQDSFKALIENFSVTYLGESLGSNGRVIAALLAAFFDDTSARLDALIDPGAGLLWGARFTLDSNLDPVLLGQNGAPVSVSVRIEINFRDFGLPQTITVPDGITLLTADQMALALGFGPEPTSVPTPEVALPTPTIALPTPAGTRQVAVLVTPNATPRPRFTLTPTTPPTATPTPPPTATPTPTIAPAQPLPPDTPVQFVLAPGAVANFVYSGARGDVVTFSARSLDPATGLDPVLELLDSGGVRLGFNDDLVGTRPGFNTLDSVLANVKLPDDGAYTLRINSFDPGDTGPVEVLASTLGGAAQVPTAQAASTTYPIVSVSQSNVPANGEDCTTVDLLAGETLTATVRALDTALDSRLTLRDPAGRDLAFNDDHGSSDPNLGRFDSRIADVVVAVDGPHQLCVSGFAGSAGAYDLTVTRDRPGAAPSPTLAPTAATTPVVSGEVQVINDVVRPNELFFTSIHAEAGDVYTLTARALDPALDPQVGIFFEDDNEPLFVNDDHSSSSPDLAFYDARLTNIILPETGRYDVAVAGYQDSAGPFELTIERTARGGPLGEPVVQTIPGKLETNGVYVYEADLPAGAYVTITVAAVDENFDPQVTLITPEGVIAIDNDDHSSGDATLRASDSRIHNYLVEQGGVYTIEIRGYQGVGGFFTLTIATLQ